jgi:arabinan endo-1,5-alpha-L-arabinosidase
MKREAIQIRDPFILTVESEGKYYLYGTTDKNCWSGEAVGFDTYCSSNLEEWEGPFEAFRPEENFWADRHFWAPEVYFYNQRFYMFASFKAEGICRGTQVLVSDNPKGPFKLHSKMPLTPKEWECLDGTLYIDENKTPWMVFCREWLQVGDGEMYAMKLSQQLDSAVGEPQLLFTASQAVWSRSSERELEGKLTKVNVTDGPFIYKAKNGELLMMWSSSGYQGYAIGIARSASGNILGPWKQEEDPLYGKDGGHGMLFKSFDNQLMLTIHTPNKTPNERPTFYKVIEAEGKLTLEKDIE